jgi:hypothetical protein
VTDSGTLEDAPLKVGPRWWWVWGFHLLVGGTAAVMLFSWSYPGVHVYLFWAGGAVAGLLGCWWLGWIVYVTTTTGRRWRWFLVGPAIAVLTASLMAAAVPLQLRWAASRAAFDAVVAGHPLPPKGSEWRNFDVPARVGTYRIDAAYWVPGGAVFFEANGAFIDEAGFAYLPGGPGPDLPNTNFEAPQYKSLGGGWYSFTSGR